MRYVTCLLTLLLLVSPAQAQPASDSAAVVTRAQQYVEALAAPAMRGRGYTGGGHRRAARYIRRQFEEIGLQPVEGSYTQPFRIRPDLITKVPSLSVDGRPLPLGASFLPVVSSASGKAERTGPVVPVGPGLVLPEQGYSAYEGVSAEGAVVVIESGVPDSIRQSDAIPAPAYSRAARLQHAEDAGAQAAILLVDRLSLSAFNPYDAGIPVFQVKESAWPASPQHVSYQIAKKRDQTITTQNVMGRVEGTVHPDTTILLTAHYDHVGALGDSIYFAGANDNASGVALLLSLARYFEAHPLPYSLVFVAFSGEEIGLRGSHYFSTHPPVDLRAVKFLLNFDMVASGEKGIMAVGGVDFPRQYDLLKAVNKKLEAGPLRRRKNAANSDHYFITQQGVPGFFLYTNGGSQPYHHVKDVPATLEWEDFWHAYRLSRSFLEQL